MRKVVITLVALAAICAVVLLSGCASSAPPEPAADSASPAAAPATTPTAQAKTAGSTGQLSSPPITDPRPFPQVNVLTAPPAVLDALKGKRAFFLVFYDADQSVTSDQKNVVAGLASKYKGLIEFISFNLPKTDELSSDAEKKSAATVAQLGQQLGVGYMPAIVVVTNEGLITWQSSGYYDSGTLEREILRATK
jgi:outer membrane murein-binding lipoprotein Lpp